MEPIKTTEISVGPFPLSTCYSVHTVTISARTVQFYVYLYINAIRLCRFRHIVRVCSNWYVHNSVFAMHILHNFRSSNVLLFLFLFTISLDSPFKIIGKLVHQRVRAFF
jgi:hypothetical protein